MEMNMIKRDDALHVLREFVREEDLVVAVYQTCFDWLVICPRDLNYVSVGAMGQASSHALGLAIGSPNRQIIVLDGDGSLLMNLGSLVTIGEIHPEKFLHLVFENGVYEVNGGQPIPGKGQINFARIAESSGYFSAHAFDKLADFKSMLPTMLNSNGPAMGVVKVVPGAMHPTDYEFIHSRESRRRFREALKHSVCKEL
jgi:sulfopyruvate decarboxylase subunit beta